MARVHASAWMFDTHNDIPLFTIKGDDIGKSLPKRHTDIARLRAGNTGAVYFSVWTSPRLMATKGAAAKQTRAVFATIHNDIIKRYPATFELARTAGDVERIRKAGKIAALIGIEGGHSIENSLDLLREFHKAGAGYMTLTHSESTAWADSAGTGSKAARRRSGGLSDFGRKVVAEMNRLGMIVDVSHVADETFYDVLEISRVPVFASHSSCRALTNHPRNMTDDMIRALARKGGVIQINFGCWFINKASRDASLRSVPAAKLPRATLADVVAHIEHAVKVGGIDAVGIGPDYDGVECVPVGLDDVSKYPALTRALLERGYTAEQIRKLYHGNTLRVMRAVEAARGR